jgi:hypothetical protein
MPARHLTRLRLGTLAAALLLVVTLIATSAQAQSAPLASWNDGDN